MSLFSSLLIFGLAFVVIPFGTSWYEIPKVIVALISVASLTIPFFWQERQWKNSYSLILGIFLLSICGLVLQRTPTMFFGNPYRLQGVLTVWGLLFWSIVSSQTRQIKNQSLLAILTLLITVFFAIIGSIDASGRAVGSIGEANSLGALIVFLTPLTQSVVAIIPAAIGIILSGSRSALLGIVLSISLRQGAKRIQLNALAVFASILLLAACFFPFLDTKQDFEYRADIWRTAVRAGREKPLFGWGVGNVEVGLKSAAELEQTFLRYQYVDSSHNVFLDWWVQGGIVGLILFSSIVALSIRGLVIQKEIRLLASLFGILAVMLFNPVSISILIPFWWIVGKGIATDS